MVWSVLLIFFFKDALGRVVRKDEPEEIGGYVLFRRSRDLESR